MMRPYRCFVSDPLLEGHQELLCSDANPFAKSRSKVQRVQPYMQFTPDSQNDVCLEQF